MRPRAPGALAAACAVGLVLLAAAPVTMLASPGWAWPLVQALGVALLGAVLWRARPWRSPGDHDAPLAATLDGIDGAVLRRGCDNDWTLCYASLGLSRLTGRTNGTPMRGGLLAMIHAEDRARVRAQINEAAAAGRPWLVEYRILHADGQARWVAERGRVFPDGLAHCLLLDITARKQDERSAATARAQLEAFVSHAPAAVAMFDREMRYVAFSRRWASDYSLDASSLAGRGHYEVFPEIPERWKAIHRRCLSGAVERCEEDRFERSDGSVQWLRWEVRPWLDEHGAIGGLMMLTEEVTQIRRAREELDQARRQAESASRAKSEFLANMSHELRSPLTSIMGGAELLADDGAGRANPAELGRTILASARHLLGIISDILDLSKIEAGRMTLERVECSPREIVEEVAAMMRPRALGKGLALMVEWRSTPPARMKADPTRLRQVLVNLLGNAIKFTELGSVAVRCSITRGQVGFCRIWFEVEDTGVGMNAAHAAKLFTPFEQGDGSMARRYGGSGLGLDISRRLCRMMGGDVELVRTAPGEGSCFRASVVAEIVAGAAQAPAAGTPEAAPSRADHPLQARILLAEDGPENQRLLAFHLRKAGAEVVVANNGLEAMEHARASAFDVVLMDMQMPELDGYEATRRLRAAGYAGPIVALTAHAMSDDRERCLSVGCDDYATKPIARADLIALCRSWAGRQAAA